MRSGEHPGTDLLSILEASYRVETAEDPWLRGLLSAARPSLDEGLGVFAISHNAFTPKSFELRCMAAEGIPDRVREPLPLLMAQLPEKFIENARGASPCILSSEIEGFEEIPNILELLHPAGAHDVLGINVRDTTGIGCYFGAILPRRGRLSARRRRAWSRVSAHVAAAFRIQRALAGKPADEPVRRAEAILDAEGHVHHATGEAEPRAAREALRSATAAIQHARGAGREAPDEGLDAWKGLVAARWSLVEHFESDGKEYILACRNDPEVSGPTALTRREQQILGLLGVGHTTKLVAYELGISDSTVRVLLARAMGKLGARTREEALAAFLAHAASRG